MNRVGTNEDKYMKITQVKPKPKGMKIPPVCRAVTKLTIENKQLRWFIFIFFAFSATIAPKRNVKISPSIVDGMKSGKI
jgi:hypothetical protein